MLDRFLIFLAVIVGIFIVYKIAMRIEYDVLNFFGMFFAMFPLALMTVGMLVNWIIAGNTNFVWSITAYSMIPTIFIMMILFAKMFFEIILHMFFNDDRIVKKNT